MSATEKEMTAMAEEELARLQRQLRIMEDDRTAYAEETRTKLEKQRKLIKILNDEKKKILEDLNVATSANHVKEDLRNTKKMEEKIKKYEEACELVKQFKNEIKEMAEQQKKMETEIKTLRTTNVVTEQEYQTRLKSGNHLVKVLENRLENGVKKFCKVLVENKKLREEIDHLLIERSQFNACSEKLLENIKDGKKHMIELVDQATLAYDQREEWSSKLEALKRRAEHDLTVHNEEMREIKRTLDHDSRLKEFLSVKGQRRILRDLEEKERLKKEEEEQKMENQLKLYEETLTKIRGFCNEEDVEKIASQFVKQEEENFALFNYVNELNHDIEYLNTKTEELEEKINEQKEQSKEKAEERKLTLEILDKELEEATLKGDEAEKDFLETEKKFKTLLNGILDLFDLLKCEKGPILELLKESEINIHNVMIYMGTIEKKTSELLLKHRQITRASRRH